MYSIFYLFSCFIHSSLQLLIPTCSSSFIHGRSKSVSKVYFLPTFQLNGLVEYPHSQALQNGWRGVPGIHCSCMHGSPGFYGELGNYSDTSLCCMTVHYWIMVVIRLHLDGALFVQQSLVVCPKVGMSLKDKQLMATQHVYYGKDMFVWLLRNMASPLLHMW